jgi:TP901 family phage tail tape measure protein
MANKVSFIIKLQNSFSKNAKVISRQMIGLDKNAKVISRQMISLDKNAGKAARTINKRFSGRSRNLKKVAINAKDIRRQMKGIDISADKASRTINKKLSGSFSNLKNVAKNALGGVVAAFTVREFLTRGAAFQDSIADLSAITGATGEDLARLNDETLRLAKTSVTAQTEVARAIKIIASAKPELLTNQEALLGVTEQVLLLKNAGVDLEVAAIAVAEGLNQFGESSKFAARNVNILAAGSKFGSSEIAATAEAVTIAGPAARAAGLSFIQLNAAIQTVAKGGIKGSQAGTALSTIFGRLRRIGFDFKKLGLEGVFTRIGKILNRTKGDMQRAAIEAELFGDEHSKVGLALVNNVKFLSQFEKSLKGTNVAQEQADIRLGTFNAKLRRLGISLNDKVIKTFLRLEPVLTKQVTNLGKFFDTIKPDQIEAVGDSLRGVIEVLGVLGDAIKIPLALFKGIGTAVGEFAASVATLDFFGSQRTSFADAFSIGGKFLGVFEREKGGTAQNVGAGVIKSQADINVNLRAPAGVIESVKTSKSGNRTGLNMGVNMEPAG